MRATTTINSVSPTPNVARLTGGSAGGTARPMHETQKANIAGDSIPFQLYLSSGTGCRGRPAMGGACRVSPIRFILTEIRCNTLVKNRGNVQHTQIASYATDTHLL